jgi:hypothetical protein
MSSSVNPPVYVPGVCWYQPKARKKADTPTCGNRECRLYSVTSGHVNVTPEGPTAEMWLCPQHVKSMLRKHYIVTEVTLHPVQQGAILGAGGNTK